MGVADYNALHPMTIHKGKLAGIAVLVLFFIVPCATANWTAPATDLAREIVAISGPGPASLELRNLSSVPGDQLSEIRRALETQLRAAGVQIAQTASAAAEIRVSLSENLQGWLWIAEVVQGPDTKVAMVAVPRGQRLPPVRSGPSVTLHKTLVWAQPRRILDAVVVASDTPNPHLIVLDATSVTLYKPAASAKWESEQTLPIISSQPFPRDLRGRLALAQEHLFDAYLPGLKCSSTATAPISMNCHQSDDPWPVGPQSAFFNSARNYFTGVLAPGIGKQSSPFFSAAPIEKAGYTLWLLAGVDRKIRLLDAVNERVAPASVTRDWGSDVASVQSGCGSGVQVLATGRGDEQNPDSLLAYELPDRDLLAVSAALEFSGPITALWTVPDGKSAMAVVHEFQTGRYEAYKISITCDQ